MKKSLRELCTAIAICFCATGNLFATDNQFNTDHTMDKNFLHIPPDILTVSSFPEED